MRRALATLVLAALVPLGCGRASERALEVRMRYSRFLPASLTVKEGTTVDFTLVNADPIDHEFIIGDRVVQIAHELGTEAFHPPRPGEITIPAGETVSTTFTFGERDLLFGCHLPGHYVYGMRGTIDVV